MKPAIAYGIIGSFEQMSWQIIAITSERKRGDRAQVYGRDLNGNPTHAANSDVYGRFETQDEAEIALRAVNQLVTDHATLIDEAMAKMGELVVARDAAVKHALDNITITQPGAVA